MSNSQTRALTSEPHLTAYDIAKAFLRDSPINDERHDNAVLCTCLVAAEYLTLKGAPLCWDCFDAPGFFEKLGFLPKDELHEIALVLMGLFGWMLFTGAMAPGPGTTILRSISDQFPECQPLTTLCDKTSSNFQLMVDEVC